MVKNVKTNFIILLIWFIISLIIFTISSLFTYFGSIDISNKSIFVYLLGVLIFFVLGLLSGNIKQNNGLFNGIIFSVVVIIILMLYYFLGLEKKFSLDILIKSIVFILSSGLGGVIGVNFKPLIKK